MIVNVSPEFRERIIDYCSRCFPLEACGFVVGECNEKHGAITAQDLIPIRNVSGTPEIAFEMDPAELVGLLAHTPQERLLGIFHSHPTMPPVPSEADRQTAWHTLPSYWMVSFQDRNRPELAVYEWHTEGKQKRLLRLR